MGIPFSKSSRQSSASLGGTRRRQRKEIVAEQQNNARVVIPAKITKDSYNNAVMDLTRKQLQMYFSTFFLNQVLLGLQFFGNFEREKQQARERCSSLEQELTDKLENFTIMLPNVLDEAVEKRVHYKPKHGPNKANSLKLCMQQVYVVFEKLEISKREDPNYAEISPPTSKLFIETEHCDEEDLKKAKKGYVRLKLRQHLTSKTIRNPHFRDDICETSTDCSLSECEMTSNTCSESVGEQYGFWTSDSRKSSGNMTSTTCNTYDYLYTARLNSHLPLNELSFSGDSSNLDEMSIPSDCISRMALSDDGLLHPREGEEEIEHPEPPLCRCEQNRIEDDDASDYSDETLCDCPQHDHIQVTVTVSYLNSAHFMSYFAEILKEKIAPELGISADDLNSGTFREASIFVSSHEVIPALHYPHWPDCAADFIRRVRPIHSNYGQRIQWPTPEMIRTVTSFGCHAIPVGYATKKNKNLTRDLEWKIVFPKAERYLESQLLSTQVKIYMLCKALIKAHLEPNQTGNVRMFTMDHLRTHLFWTCEENFTAWPDLFLGEALVRFLNSFLDRLSKSTLPDYFIPKRNLFANIPQSSISRFHQLITKIAWNAAMYTIRVSRDLHLAPDFYPKFDYKKLVSIARDDPLLLMSLRDMKPVEVPVQNNTINSIKKEKKIGQKNIGNKKRMSNRRKKRREQKPDEEVKKRTSVDSVDLQFIIRDAPVGPQNEYHSSPDDMRRILAVKTFLSYFISMTKTATKLKAFDQAKIYLHQCQRLCILLKEFGEDAFEAQSQFEIAHVEKLLAKYQEQTNGPALPVRTNLEPVKSFRQLKQPLATHNGHPENGRIEKAAKLVQFNKTSNFIEPRSSLFVRADLHSSENQVKIARPGILKQSSIVESNESNDSKIVTNNDVIENWRKNGTIKAADDIERDSDSDLCTEL